MRASACSYALVRSFSEKKEIARHSNVGGRAAPCYLRGRSRETRRPRTLVRRRRPGICTPRDAGRTGREGVALLLDAFAFRPKAAPIRGGPLEPGSRNPRPAIAARQARKANLECSPKWAGIPTPFRGHSARRRERFQMSKIDFPIRENLKSPPEAMAPKIFSGAHLGLRDSWPEKPLFSHERRG